MKAIFIVSAICVFLSLFWLAYYTYQKFEVQDYKESKRDIFLLVASILIIICTIITLLKITHFLTFAYFMTICFMYLGLTLTINFIFTKDFECLPLFLIIFPLSIVTLLVTLSTDFNDETKKKSTEEIRLESSIDSSENIVIIKLSKENDTLQSFCIMKKVDNDYELPLELSQNDIDNINISENGEEKLEIKNYISYSYDLMAYFGFKEPNIINSTSYTLYINKDSIRYE